MDNLKFLEVQAAKRGWNKYYLTERPVSIGTQPGRGLIDFYNFDQRTEIDGRMVWAVVYYDRTLDQSEMEEYEMSR